MKGQARGRGWRRRDPRCRMVFAGLMARAPATGAGRAAVRGTGRGRSLLRPRGSGGRENSPGSLGRRTRPGAGGEGCGFSSLRWSGPFSVEVRGIRCLRGAGGAAGAGFSKVGGADFLEGRAECPCSPL